MSERQLVCAALGPALDELRAQGFRLDLIYPADDPHTAVLSRDGESVRVTTDPQEPAPSEALPPFRPRFVLTKAGASGGEGRAGMLYRDLIPGRLGGRYIASHIGIPGAGPVADWVHYHRIAVQMIYVRCGWVRVVYEDQGEPFVMRPGDLVLQPPQIRHQVLESGDDLEVVEIGAPALHATFADDDLALPNAVGPDRLFAGQTFLRHRATQSPWTPFAGGEAQETRMLHASGGIADVRTVRGPELRFPAHDGELVFGFVLEGTGTLLFDGHHQIGPADAFVIRPSETWEISGTSRDFRLLQVTTAKLKEHPSS